jgi:hypothetical protein
MPPRRKVSKNRQYRAKNKKKKKKNTKQRPRKENKLGEFPDIHFKDFRKDAIEHIVSECVKQHGALVNHGLGTGKTLTGVLFLLNFPNQRKLIISPTSAHAEWAGSLNKVSKTPVKHVTIKNYDDLPDIIKTPPEKVVIAADEAHRLIPLLTTDKVWSASMRMQIYQWLQKSFKIMMLTGTSVKNDISDLRILINIAAGKDVIPSAPGEFRNNYYKVDKKAAVVQGYLMPIVLKPSLMAMESFVSSVLLYKIVGTITAVIITYIQNRLKGKVKDDVREDIEELIKQREDKKEKSDPDLRGILKGEIKILQEKRQIKYKQEPLGKYLGNFMKALNPVTYFKNKGQIWDKNDPRKAIWEKVLRDGASPSKAFESIKFLSKNALGNKLSEKETKMLTDGPWKDYMLGTTVTNPTARALLKFAYYLSGTLMKVSDVVEYLPIGIMIYIVIKVAQYLYAQKMKSRKLQVLNVGKLMNDIKPYIITYDPFLQQDLVMLEHFPQVQVHEQKYRLDSYQTKLLQKLIIGELSTEDLVRIGFLPMELQNQVFQVQEPANLYVQYGRMISNLSEGNKLPIKFRLIFEMYRSEKQPTLIWSNFQKGLDEFERHAEAQNFSVETVPTGKEDSKLKDAMLKRALDGKVDFLLLPPHATEGTSLPGIEVFQILEPCLDIITYQQLKARVIRYKHVIVKRQNPVAIYTWVSLMPSSPSRMSSILSLWKSFGLSSVPWLFKQKFKYNISPDAMAWVHLQQTGTDYRKLYKALVYATSKETSNVQKQCQIFNPQKYYTRGLPTCAHFYEQVF